MSENTYQDNFSANDPNSPKPRFEMDDWWNRRNIGEKVGLGIGIGILGVAGMALFTLVFMTIWNAVVPAVFEIGTINYWQALGILVLSWIVFGSARSSNGSSKRRSNRA